MNRLRNKLAIITGATRGSGLVTAKLFAAESARVFITGRPKAELDAAVDEVGLGASGIRGDTAQLAGLDRWFATVRDEAGTVDVFLANAGGCTSTTPLGQFGEPKESASITLFVASDESGFLKSSELFVGGGCAQT